MPAKIQNFKYPVNIELRLLRELRQRLNNPRKFSAAENRKLSDDHAGRVVRYLSGKVTIAGREKIYMRAKARETLKPWLSRALIGLRRKGGKHTVTVRLARLARRATAESITNALSIWARSNGVQRFRWITMLDNRVRPLHRKLHGKTYLWSKGHPTEGLPGDPWGCRCVAIPIPGRRSPPVSVPSSTSRKVLDPYIESWQKDGKKMYPDGVVMVPVEELWSHREYTWTRSTARSSSSWELGIKTEENQPLSGPEKWDLLVKALKEGGWSEDQPLHFVIGGKGGQKVDEGNHRLAIARAAGIKEVPVEIHFYDRQVTKASIEKPKPGRRIAEETPKDPSPDAPKGRPVTEEEIEEIWKLLH